MAASDYGTVAVLVLVVIALTAVILILAHLIGPKRRGPIKDATYESGMVPLVDARRRFHVRFYLVAVMYLVFGVEVVFLYPWAVLFPRLREGLAGKATDAEWANKLAAAGYGPWYLFAAILVFFVLLLVGFVYEWRKGIFRWD